MKDPRFPYTGLEMLILMQESYLTAPKAAKMRKMRVYTRILRILAANMREMRKKCVFYALFAHF